MNAIAVPPPERPTGAGVEPGQLMLLFNVDWDAYEAIGEALRDRPNLRMTYDRGRLEFMTLSSEHERISRLLGRLVEVLAEELNLRYAAAGSTTYKQQAVEKGLEPDQCFYLANLDRVRGLKRIDLNRDPPPDLAIEVDVTHASIDRMVIYAKIGVPEVWRWRSDGIRVYLLTADGQYTERETSDTMLVDFAVNELVRFVHLGLADNDFDMVRAFRAWLRQYIADRGLTS